MSPITRSRRLGPLKLGAAGFTVFALTALAACAPPAEGEEAGDAVLHVAELGATPGLEKLLAASGEDEGLDYEVEYSLFPAGPNFIEAVPSGSVDLIQMADTPTIFGQVAGVETKVVGVQESFSEGSPIIEIFSKKDSGITSAKDLKGKKVGITEGTILQYTVVKALEEAGLSYDDITPVNLPLTDLLSAYQSGDIDAVSVPDPYLSQLALAGDTAVANSNGITSGYSYAVATTAALEDETKSEHVVDYFERLNRARAWSVENKEEWLPQFVETSGLPEPVAKNVLDRTGENWVGINDEVIEEQQEQADTFHELGLIGQKLDVSEQYDDRFNDRLTAK